MRTVFASLILAAGLAGAAEAQTSPAAPAAVSPTAAPSAPAAAPAASAAAAEPPALPTSGDGAAILQALDKVCVPAVRGQGLEAAAKAAGLRENRRDETWTMPLGSGRDYVIIFQPQFSQRNICQAEVRFAVGQDKPIVDAINVWAFVHKPELTLGANYVAVDADGVKRTRKSWEHVESNGASTAVNFSIERKPDGTPLNARYDTGMLFYQERTGS